MKWKKIQSANLKVSGFPSDIENKIQIWERVTFLLKYVYCPQNKT